MIHPGKFGGIPFTGSRDIVGTRICHAKDETDADTEIRTEPICPPLTFCGGGGGGGGGDIKISQIYQQLISLSLTRYKSANVHQTFKEVPL